MPNIIAIQILRAVAALGVVLVHAGVNSSYWGKIELPWAQQGNAGVDLFFVISGFIMVFISWDKFACRGASLTFFIGRIVRIGPLYWLITTIFVLFGTYPLLKIIGSYLFFWTGEGPIIYLGWTLNY